MAKNRKMLIVRGGALALIIVASAVFYFVYRAKQRESAGSTPAQIESQAAAIIKSGDVSQCSSIDRVVNGVNYETVCKNNIAWDKAQQDLDIAACNDLDGKLMSVADCQNSVIDGLVAKAKDFSVCGKFSGPLKNTCENQYWSASAAAKIDPSLCKNIISSSSAASMNCEYNIILNAPEGAVGAFQCSIFSGQVKTDCENYQKGNCGSITFPGLIQACSRK
jgi:hypothetical protein